MLIRQTALRFLALAGEALTGLLLGLCLSVVLVIGTFSG
jgi:hypothetical protein